jgi:hypothetical protein
MTFLPKLIARLGRSRQSATGTKNLSMLQDETEERPSRHDLLWDEALMASMHSEAARIFLDYMGARLK